MLLEIFTVYKLQKLYFPPIFLYQKPVDLELLKNIYISNCGKIFFCETGKKFFNNFGGLCFLVMSNCYLVDKEKRRQANAIIIC